MFPTQFTLNIVPNAPDNQDLEKLSLDLSVKHYANDPAKANARELLRHTIESDLLSIKNPSDVMVVCLPGIDCLEVFDVYDKLNIPRKNIVLIEQDLEIARVIHQRVPGAQVMAGTVEDFVNMRLGSFDVASFDYTGPLRKEQLSTLGVLCDQAKSSRLIVHQANLVRRDAVSDPIYRSFASTTPEVFRAWCKDDLKAETIAHDKSHAEYDAIRAAREDYSEHRSNAFKMAIGYAIGAGVDREGHERMLEFLLGEKNARKIVRQILPKVLDQFPLLDGSPYGKQYHKLSETSAQWGLVVERELRLFLSRAGPTPRELHMFAHEALTYAFGRPRSFHIGATSSYSYISESGSPMYGEIMTAYQRPEFEASAKRFISIFEPGSKLTPGIFKNNFSDFVKRLHPPRLRQTEPERQFLGNSARPVLTKDRAIDGFRNGKNVDDLKREYRGWSKMPLAQWKAHYTMGTYNPIETHHESDTSETIDSESVLTKTDAIDLLDAGVPPEEVSSAYPTSFSVRQLRAFKAHLTMGTYKK